MSDVLHLKGSSEPGSLRSLKLAGLLAQEWDGIPRLSAWLASGEPTPQQKQQARDWLSSLPLKTEFFWQWQPQAVIADQRSTRLRRVAALLRLQLFQAHRRLLRAFRHAIASKIRRP